MSNRRRVKGGRVTPRAPRPIGGDQEGIEINVEGPDVIFRLYMGRATMAVGWTGRDAETIANLLLDAAKQAQGAEPESKEVVRGTGLVIPGTKDIVDVARAIES